jgi:short-subunit dehydrogenase
VYYASKAFVNSFTEALHFELRGTGVTATLSCPGPTETEFAQVARNGKTRLFKMGSMGAPEVAAHAYDAMMRGTPIAVPGLRNKLGLQSLRVAPRALVRRAAAALNRVEE